MYLREYGILLNQIKIKRSLKDWFSVIISKSKEGEMNEILAITVLSLFTQYKKKESNDEKIIL